MARIEYDAVAEGYAQSRALPLDAIPAWRDAVARWLPARRPVRIVDVGSGTGIFARAFVAWFGAHVMGVEPSDGMLAEATRGGGTNVRGGSVSFVRGDVHALPLRDASCDAAWLSTVIHHFADLPAAAREVARVVRGDGIVLIRSSFPGRHDRIELFRRFPGASRVASTFPTIEQTEAAFANAGFALRHLESVPQVSAPGLRAFAERVRTRADTTLQLMPDYEFEESLAALERDVASLGDRDTAPIIDHLDLLVLTRQAANARK